MSSSRNLAQVSVSLGAALAVLCAPMLAQAEKYKVVVVPFAPLYDAVPRTTGEKIAGTLEGGLQSKDSVELVKLPAEGGGAAKSVAGATPEQLAAVEAAKAELDKGKKLLARRKVKPALDAFGRAIEGFEANGPALLDVNPLVEAHLKRGVTLFLMGREGEARDAAIPAALRLAPGVKLAAGDEYQQVFIDLVEKVRASMAEAGYGNLRVDTAPSGAKVWVDAEEASYTPVQVTGLVPGVHYIKIKPAGTDPYVQVVTIEKGQTFRISPDDGAAKGGMVQTLVTQLSKNELNEESKQQVKALAQKVGAQYAVVGGAYVQVNNMGMITFVYSAKDDSFFELKPAKFDRDMLFATTEINNVANELASKLPGGGTPVALPRQVAADAKAGAEKINEVDFAGALLAGSSAVKGGATPASGPRGPVEGRRRGPVTKDRKPVGAGTPPAAAAPAPAGGSKRPVVGDAAPAPAPAPVASAPAEPAPGAIDLDFKADPKPEPKPEEKKPSYTFSGGASIEDEQAFDEQKKESGGGLLSKWWFWAGAGVLAAGAVGVGIAAGGGDSDAMTGKVRW